MDNLDFKKHIPLDKTCLIEASAGTGKTFSITNIFLNAVMNGVPIEKILVVTYTEAATKELRSRIRSNLHNALDWLKGKNDDTTFADIFALCSLDKEKQRELLEEELLKIDQASIFTVHSFCQQMLLENAFESKIAYGAELLTDTNGLIREIVENFWREKLLNVPESQKDIYQDLKFDDFLSLAKELIKYHEVKMVNDTLPAYEDVPATDSQLDADYSDIVDETQIWVNKLESQGLKEEILDLFNKYQDMCNKSYSEDIEEKIDKLITALTNVQSTNVVFFTREKILKSALKAKFTNESVSLSTHELFDFCSRYLDIVKRKKSQDKIISDAQENNQNIVKIELQINLNSYLREKFPAIKEERNLLTFDDLLIRLYQALKEEGTDGPLAQIIRTKYQLVLVDEFQDTDNIQYKIFHHLFYNTKEAHGFYMIGDPKQSIYKFRSADIFCYLAAKQDADHLFTLDTNYRSEDKMVDAINTLFSFKGANETFAFPPQTNQAGITYKTVKASKEKAELKIDDNDADVRLALWLVDGRNDTFIERNIASNIAEEIVRLMTLSNTGKAYFDDGHKTPLCLGDIALLVNTHKQAAMLKDVLSKSNIAAAIQNSTYIFSSWEARELQLWMKALIQPIESNIRPLFVTNLLNLPACGIDNIEDHKMLEFTEELTLLHKLWQKNGFFSIFLSYLSKHKVREKVLAKVNGDRILTNYIHLAELLHKQELSIGKSIEKTLTYLEHQIAEEKSNDEFVQRLESDRKSVKIMTIHKSKGLEFPLVFCPFLWSNSITRGESVQKVFLFNEMENGKYIQKLDFGADKEMKHNNQLLTRRETLAEHVRLMYVALTRAGNRCYLPIGKSVARGKSVLGYIFTDELVGGDEKIGIINKLSGRGTTGYVQEISDAVLEGIKKFNESSDNVNLKNKSDVLCPSKLPLMDNQQAPELKPKYFGKNNLKQWGVSSFSGLTENHLYKGGKTDKGTGVFSLPKGKNFGNAIHKIFQNYFTYGKEHFYNNMPRYFEAPLKTDRFFRSANDNTRSARFAIAQKMFENTLNHSIKVDHQEFSLGNIASGDVKTEFPFFYKINTITTTLLQNIFRDYGIETIKDFAEELGTLNFSPIKGYMKGDIDLLFRNNGQYFVLDWKSNHLGPKTEKYCDAQLRKTMNDECYFLQYHIYALAIHLFLKQQLNNYDYDKDFGGVFYIYTRGIDPAGNGIFFDKPPRALIEELEKQLCTQDRTE